MNENSSYWECLKSISEAKTFKEQADIFRYFAHVAACDTVDIMVQRFINDATGKLMSNPLLTVEKYNLQCQFFITPFLFQPPLFNCSTQDERAYYNGLFSNWKPNDYCIDFYQKLKKALGLNENN